MTIGAGPWPRGGLKKKKKKRPKKTPTPPTSRLQRETRRGVYPGCIRGEKNSSKPQCIQGEGSENWRFDE